MPTSPPIVGKLERLFTWSAWAHCTAWYVAPLARPRPGLRPPADARRLG
ncbi:hypothetical protein [Nocardioides guangzhouensis]|nr:hypothetical protein [Nocardioides guangzhouensis]